MLDIKKLAQDYHTHREAMTVADIETLLQGVYEEGRQDRFDELFLIKKDKQKEIIKEVTEADEKDGLYDDIPNVGAKIISESPSINTQSHYKGKESLYKFAEDWQLNAWEFDLIKRLVRCRHKGQFKEDLQKTRDLLDIYEKEYKPNK